jgi:hypothetical protein
MTNYAGYMWPVDQITQSVDRGYVQTNVSPALMALAAIPRPQPYELTNATEQSPIGHLDRTMIMGTITRNNVQPANAHNRAAFIMPTYSNDLLGHWLLVPSILNLGNLLSNQERTIEVANLFPTQKEIASVTNATDSGVTLVTGTLPVIVNPYNSYVLQVNVSTLGPPNINGTITLVGENLDTTDPESLVVPVTGARITLFPWDPEQGYTEQLEWKTDILESYSGIEQRISIRYAPRQKLTYTPFMTNTQKDMQLRMVLFNWLPRVWGVPIWWEQAQPTQACTPGSNFVAINTANADYRVGGLVMLMAPDLSYYETFQIATISSTELTFTSGAITVNNYPVNAKVMPVRTAYAKTQTQSRTLITGAERVSIEFTTLDNVNLANIGTWDIYQGLPILDDINYVDSELTEGMARNGVTIIDNASGTIYQQASTDRSRPTSVKTWWTGGVAAPNGQSAIWTIRQLLHWLNGSQSAFWVPTNKNDMTVTATITGGATIVTIEYIGYTLFGLDASSNPMRPFGDVRMTLTNGTVIIRQITGATVTGGGATETISVNSQFSATNILPANIARLEFLMLMRIADDKVLFTHDHPGRAQIVANLVGVRE